MNADLPALARSRPVRFGYAVLGLSCVAVGGIGIIVPGLPTTVFFIVAAACFSRSSPRLERWVFGLPKIGPMVRDYRLGLGMPLRAKIMATMSIAIMSTLSVVFVDHLMAQAAIIAAVLVGLGYIWLRVPTRRV